MNGTHFGFFVRSDTPLGWITATSIPARQCGEVGNCHIRRYTMVFQWCGLVAGTRREPHVPPFLDFALLIAMQSQQHSADWATVRVRAPAHCHTGIWGCKPRGNCLDRDHRGVRCDSGNDEGTLRRRTANSWYRTCTPDNGHTRQCCHHRCL